jgi:signal peptidase I
MTRVLAIAASILVLAGCGTDHGTRKYRVPSSSMEPTLHCARPGAGCEASQMDFVAARPYGSRKPERGDLVVFHTPPAARLKCGAGGVFVKRLVGLPGERWAEKAGFIYLDGRKLAEPYVRPARRDGQSFAGGVIPPGRYLLLGDNRASSCDSRIWGLVPRANLIGWVFEIRRGSKRIDIR